MKKGTAVRPSVLATGRTGTFSNTLRQVFYGPALAGMPPGTRFWHELEWAADHDAYCMHVVFETGDNYTSDTLVLNACDWKDEGRLTKEVSEFFVRVQARHWLATYNVWEGWRI